MTTATRRARRLAPAIALIGVGALALSACSGGSGSGSGSGAGDGEFSYLGQTENTTIITTLETLAGDQCKAAADAAPLTSDDISGTQWDQQLQLLIPLRTRDVVGCQRCGVGRGLALVTRESLQRRDDRGVLGLAEVAELAVSGAGPGSGSGSS